jgi:hypothetical protein
VRRIDKIEPEFVREIPRDLAPGKLYVSIVYSTATHLCCCGCGNEVVTPIHPTRWALTYDGETISLYPSVGSWNLQCQSHYVLETNRVRWARRWSKEQIDAGRACEQGEISAYFSLPGEDPISSPSDGPMSTPTGRLRRLWCRITSKWSLG